MSDPTLRARLLGLQSFAPPEALQMGSRLKTAEAYRAFLQQALADPRSYWATLAKKLHWEDEPSGPGNPGSWFPEGRLNLTVSCLDRWIESDEGTDEALVAITGLDRKAVSREEIISRVGIFCELIQSWSLAPGDRILLAFPRGYDLLVSVLASLRLGLSCVPVDPTAGDPGRLHRRARATGCRAAVTNESVMAGGSLDDFDSLPVEHRLALEPDWERDAYAPPAPVAVNSMHPAFVLADESGRVFSLSTIGVGLQGISAYRYLLDGHGRGDSHWFQTPSHHASFLTGSLGALSCGGRVITPEAGVAATPFGFLAALAQEQPRVVVTQAKVLERLVQILRESGSPDPCTVGPDLLVVEGASVAPSLYRTVRNQIFDGGTHVVQVLSRPETGGFLAGPHPGAMPVRPACAGLPAPGLTLEVIDHRGRPSRMYHGGYLALGGIPPGLALELQGLATPISLGLRARMDRAGAIWSVGQSRVDRTSTERVPATEVEAIAAAVEGVERVAVVHYRDQDGELHGHAFVQAAMPAGVEERIRTRLTERLGEEAVPDAIQLVSALPYGRTGKLLRSVLRRIAAGKTTGLEGLGLTIQPKLVRELIAGSQKRKQA